MGLLKAGHCADRGVRVGGSGCRRSGRRRDREPICEPVTSGSHDGTGNRLSRMTGRHRPTWPDTFRFKRPISLADSGVFTDIARHGITLADTPICYPPALPGRPRPTRREKSGSFIAGVYQHPAAPQRLGTQRYAKHIVHQNLVARRCDPSNAGRDPGAAAFSGRPLFVGRGRGVRSTGGIAVVFGLGSKVALEPRGRRGDRGRVAALAVRTTETLRMPRDPPHDRHAALAPL